MVIFGICGSENPGGAHQQPTHPPPLTVWCGFWAGEVTGLYFFENEVGNANTINVLRYRNILCPESDRMDVDGIFNKMVQPLIVLPKQCNYCR